MLSAGGFVKEEKSYRRGGEPGRQGGCGWMRESSPLQDRERERDQTCQEI